MTDLQQSEAPTTATVDLADPAARHQGGTFVTLGRYANSASESAT